MGKHTPGPMTVYVKPDTKTLEVRQADGKPVIHWMGFDGVDQPWEERVANAYLFASAATVYSALDWLITLIRHSELYDEAGELTNEGEEVFSLGIDTLAEARGEGGDSS